MLDIIGKDVKLWVNTHETRKGTFDTYTISVSKKVEDKYVNKPVRLIFSKDTKVPNGLKSGDRVDFEGFPSLDIYTDRYGNERRDIVIFAKTVRFLDHEDDADEEDLYAGFGQAADDIPF